MVAAAMLISAGSVAPSVANAETLKDVVQKAISAHPRVLNAQANRNALQGAADAQFGNLLPVVEFNGRTGYEKTQNSSSANPILDAWVGDVQVTGTQLLYDGFETFRRTDAAELEAKAAGKTLGAASRDIAIRAIEDYLVVMREREVVALAKDNVAIHRKTANDVRLLSDQGRGNKGDVYQAKSRLALARTRLNELTVGLRNAEASYKEAVGEMPGSLEAPKLASDLVPPTVEAAVESALANDPQYLAAGTISKARGQELKAAKGALYHPTVNLETQYTKEKDFGGRRELRGDGTVLLTLNYNLYRGGSDKARQREAA